MLHKLRALHIKPRKPSQWFPKTPRRQDDLDEQSALLEPTGVTAPPNSPHREKSPKLLFGQTTHHSEAKATRHQRFHDTSSQHPLSEPSVFEHSSDESPRAEKFFGQRVSLDPETVGPVVTSCSTSPDRHTTALRDSVRRLSQKQPSSPRTRGRHESEEQVALQGDIAADRPTLQGLELKQAAARAPDREHPENAILAFKDWLFSAQKCKGDLLRVKDPGGTDEVFMSRSLYSAKKSWKTQDADRDKDITEQLAAYRHLDGLARLDSPQWTPAVRRAQAALKAHLKGLKQHHCDPSVNPQGTYRRVKDTPQLRELVLALAQAVAPEADRPRIPTPYRADQQTIALSEDDRTSSGDTLLERSV